MNPKPDKTIPAIYAGIIMGLATSVPFLNLINCLCCAGFLLGGILGVMFYKNNFTPDTPSFTVGDCMAVGALAGVVSAVISTFLSVIFVKLFGNIMGEFLMDLLKNMNVEIPDEAWRAIEESVNTAASPLAIIVHLFSSLVLDSLFGLLGGLIGYSVYKPKQQVMPPPPMPQPL